MAAALPSEPDSKNPMKLDIFSERSLGTVCLQNVLAARPKLWMAVSATMRLRSCSLTRADYFRDKIRWGSAAGSPGTLAQDGQGSFEAPGQLRRVVSPFVGCEPASTV